MLLLKLAWLFLTFFSSDFVEPIGLKVLAVLIEFEANL